VDGAESVLRIVEGREDRSDAVESELRGFNFVAQCVEEAHGVGVGQHAAVIAIIPCILEGEVMAETNRQHYAPTGHPSVDQLMAEQGTGPIADVSVLHGDFWPEEESIGDFLDTLREWRGHRRSDPAA